MAALRRFIIIAAGGDTIIVRSVLAETPMDAERAFRRAHGPAEWPALELYGEREFWKLYDHLTNRTADIEEIPHVPKRPE